MSGLSVSPDPEVASAPPPSLSFPHAGSRVSCRRSRFRVIVSTVFLYGFYKSRCVVRVRRPAVGMLVCVQFCARDRQRSQSAPVCTLRSDTI